MSSIEWRRKGRIIAIVRGLASEKMLMLADALARGGIQMIEVTFNQKEPLTWRDTAAAITAIGKEFPDILTGAGTVLTMDQLQIAYNAGAKYIVTPSTNPDIIRRGKELGLCMFPGAMTPTEIVNAYEAGADAVKVFPASLLGHEYIKAVRAPLSHIPLIAVGGIDEKNAADFIRAGCVCLGCGGSLVNKDFIAACKWNQVSTLAAEFVKAAHAV